MISYCLLTEDKLDTFISMRIKQLREDGNFMQYNRKTKC